MSEYNTGPETGNDTVTFFEKDFAAHIFLNMFKTQVTELQASATHSLKYVETSWRLFCVFPNFSLKATDKIIDLKVPAEASS